MHWRSQCEACRKHHRVHLTSVHQSTVRSESSGAVLVSLPEGCNGNACQSTYHTNHSLRELPRNWIIAHLVAHAACYDLMIVVRYSTGSDSGKAFTVKIEMYKWSIAKSRRSLTLSMKSLAEGWVLGSTPVRNGAGRSCEVGAMSRRLASRLALKLRVDGWPGFGDASDGDAWEERSI